MIPELTEDVLADGGKCAVCGGRIAHGESVWRLEVEKGGMERRQYLHQSCHYSVNESAFWSFFWDNDACVVVRVVVFPDGNGWGVYSQREGRAIHRWGRVFESRYSARESVDQRKDFTRLVAWGACRPRQTVAA
ncbi:hypothetical protein GF324_14100 [bacterium]|nr:hypothetical protein [bacterium]